MFTSTPNDQRVNIGSSVEFPCHAKGQPLPKIKWKKDGILMSSESDHHRVSSNGDLYMFNILPADDGLYECIAENDIGTASVAVRLNVVSGKIFCYKFVILWWKNGK